MTAMSEPSVSGLTHVVFYDGSRMPIAELVDELVGLLCLEGDSSWMIDLGVDDPATNGDDGAV